MLFFYTNNWCLTHALSGKLPSATDETKYRDSDSDSMQRWETKEHCFLSGCFYKIPLFKAQGNLQKGDKVSARDRGNIGQWGIKALKTTGLMYILTHIDWGSLAALDLTLELKGEEDMCSYRKSFTNENESYS